MSVPVNHFQDIDADSAGYQQIISKLSASYQQGSRFMQVVAKHPW